MTSDSLKPEFDENAIAVESNSTGFTQEESIQDDYRLKVLYPRLTVLAYFFFNFSTWGSNASFSVYLTHYVNSPNFADATKLDYAAIGGLQYGAGMLIVPFFSDIIISKLSERGLMIVGIISQVLANVCASYSKKKWQLYITQGLLQSFGIAFIVIPGYSLIPKWFKTGNKTFAQGVTNMGTSLGGLFFCLFNEKIIDSKGVDFTLRIQSIICAVMSLIGLLLVRIPPKQNLTLVKPDSPSTQYKKILKNSHFWIELLWGFFNMMAFLILLYVLSDYTVSLGFSTHSGSIVASMVSVGAISGRPFFGILSDKLGSVNITLVTQFFLVIFIFAMWIPAKTVSVLIIFALIIGAIMGTLFTTMSSITIEVLQGDLSLLVNALNVFLFALSIGSTVAPIMALSLKKNANYRNAIIFTGCLNIASVLTLITLRYFLIKRDHKPTEKPLRRILGRYIIV